MVSRGRKEGKKRSPRCRKRPDFHEAFDDLLEKFHPGVVQPCDVLQSVTTDSIRGPSIVSKKVVGGSIYVLSKYPIPEHDFSAREKEVARLLRAGYSNKRIASELQIKVSSVATYLRRIKEKTGATCRADIILKSDIFI